MALEKYAYIYYSYSIHILCVFDITLYNNYKEYC